MIAFAVVAAQYVSTFDAMVSARQDARITSPPYQITVGGKPEQIAIGTDATLVGSALLHTHDRHWDFTLGYAPSITVPDLELQVDRDVQPPVTPTILNGASAGIRWHERFSWFSLTESGSYGYISTAIPYTGPGAAQQTSSMMPAQGTTGMTSTGQGMTTTGTTGTTSTTTNQASAQATLLPVRDVQYAASSTGLAVGTALGRHTTATLSGSYSLSGGLDAGTLVVPYLAGPTGAVNISTRVSPSEAVFTTASGDYSYMNGVCPVDLFDKQTQSVAMSEAVMACEMTMPAALCVNAQPNFQLPCQTKSAIGQIVEGYRRQLGLFSSVSATVGLGAVYGPGLNATQELGVVPVFSVNYSQELYTFWPGLLNVTLSLAPTVDLLTSIVSDMATAVATLNAHVTKLVIVAFSLTGTQSIPIPTDDGSPLTSIAGAVEARFRLNKQVDVVVGDQEYWQEQFYGGAPGISGGSTATFAALAYVGVTLRAPTLHF